MTSLDDALNSDSITWGEHQLYAFWEETDNGDIGTNEDSVSDLTKQFNGIASISHSYDDGLPDPVTMTSGADAAGAAVIQVNGRQGLVLASAGQRAFTSTGLAGGFFAGGNATLSAPIPNNAARGDYLVCAVLTDSVANAPVQSGTTPANVWNYLGAVQSAGNVLQLYGIQYYPNKPTLMLQSVGGFNYAMMTMAFWATNPAGSPMAWKPTKVSVFSETTSRTSHPISSTIDAGKSFQLGIWGAGSAVGPWTATSGGTEWGEQIGSGLDLMMAVSGLLDTQVQTLTASTASATASAVIAAVVLTPYNRPVMDGRQYFSPFNVDSPIYGYDRSTAGVQFNFSTITATGPVYTSLFNGVMSDIPITGRSAEIDASSASRINANTSFTLPVVRGPREGCTVDWLAAYLMARSGNYVGAAPTRFTRGWAPMYGSVHPFLAGPNVYCYGLLRTSTVGWYGYTNIPSLVGPIHTALYAEQTATRCLELDIQFGQDFPLGLENTIYSQVVPDSSGATSPMKADTWSQANSKGRISFWVRGDTVQDGATYFTDTNDNFYAEWNVKINDPTGAFLGYLRIQVPTSNGIPTVWMGSDLAGYSLYSYPSLGAITTGWNFYAFEWDFAAGRVNMKHNATEIQTTTFATDGRNVITQLPLTDIQGVASNNTYHAGMRFHVPASDFMYDVPNVSWSTWAGIYGTLAYPGATAITRPTLQWLQGIANPNPIVAWDTLLELAQASLCWLRCNEDDKMEFLPLSYFGETAQMTASSVADVALNAQDLDVSLDASKSRNVITVQFPETSISSQPVPLLSISQAITLTRGITILTFALDTLNTEIHGAGTGARPLWTLTNLTATQITTPSLPTAVHYASFNTAADGSGTVLPATTASARILAADAASITIQFTNNSGGTIYVANNGQEVPFLQILGYAISSNDGYVTQRDSGSVAARRERGLTSQLDWIQDRNTATTIAGLLVTILAKPRGQLSVVVMGDPRRRPGQLVTVADAEGTRAAGTWRILAIEHAVSGAQYVQTLSLVYVGTVLNWDDPTTTWDNSVWGP